MTDEPGVKRAHVVCLEQTDPIGQPYQHVFIIFAQNEEQAALHAIDGWDFLDGWRPSRLRVWRVLEQVDFDWVLSRTKIANPRHSVLKGW